ncbi:MAG: hypothetical protein B7Y40_05255 [Gammaproteobacteria bacterium 28-57-27]|nr:MAG: hypothetical protein B7Y40_05255 [Gammaproteobacteria bacterium 28-57-27]
MDTMTMQKLARFKIMTRRLGGFNVDIFRLAQAGDYAREILTRAQEVDNETLVLMALELSDALGLLEQPESDPASTKPSTKVKQEESKVPASSANYNFGARG